MRLAIFLVMIVIGNYQAQSSKKGGYYKELKNKSGEVVDRVYVREWPEAMPVTLADQILFKTLLKTRLHNNKVTLTLAEKPIGTYGADVIQKNRFNFGIYHQVEDGSPIELYRFGIGIFDFSFPINDNGIYYVICQNEFRQEKEAFGGDDVFKLVVSDMSRVKILKAVDKDSE